MTNINSKSVKTKELDSANINCNNINSDILKSDNINTNSLDSILSISKELISGSIVSNNLNSESAKFTKIVSNEIEAKDIRVVSDMRKKKNIKYNSISSDYLDNINLASFKYNGEDESHIGFIAQDIQKHYPELINCDKDGYLSVKYLEMIPLLLDYNQKMKKQILELQQKIN